MVASFLFHVVEQGRLAGLQLWLRLSYRLFWFDCQVLRRFLCYFFLWLIRYVVVLVFNLVCCTHFLLLQ